MATSSSKGGGFSIGVIYGLIVSIVLYLVLVFLFPINLTDISVAPNVMDNAGTQMPVVADGPSQPEGGPEPAAAEPAISLMAQPDTSENSGVSIGGAGDTSPANPASEATQIAAEPTIVAPPVETESAAVPDIGSETTLAEEPPMQTAATDAPTESDSSTVIASAAEEIPSQQVAAPAVLPETVSGPATEVFAVPFTGDTSKPMLAIVLEDTLETSLQPLVDTGKPLSFALPADVDSRESARSIRQSGYEVLAMLPSGMNRSEGVAENVTRFLENVPVAVAVIDASSRGIMLTRNSMREVLDLAVPAGLGVISFAGTGDLIARDQALRAGAVYGKVVQIIDETPDEELIVQALDRAAFEALTQGSAIVFARTKPETINAIVSWLNGAFAARLQIVPVSVAIQRQAN